MSLMDLHYKIFIVHFIQSGIFDLPANHIAPDLSGEFEIGKQIDNSS